MTTYPYCVPIWIVDGTCGGEFSALEEAYSQWFMLGEDDLDRSDPDIAHPMFKEEFGITLVTSPTVDIYSNPSDNEYVLINGPEDEARLSVWLMERT